MTTNQKIKALRNEMMREHIDALIIYSSDPHMSEYLPFQWQERTWLSGFTGSAGFVVITQDKTALWTDSRYFVQAPKEIKDSEIILMREGDDKVPNYTDWLNNELPSKSVVGTNALLASHANWTFLKAELSNKDIKLESVDLLKNVWQDRIVSDGDLLFIHPIEFAGRSVNDKLKDIRKAMINEDVNTHVVTSLDDIAWTLNLRGNDVEYNPIFLSYLIISENNATLFVDISKVNADVMNHLSHSNVVVKSYHDFFKDLSFIKDQTVWLTPNSNQAIYDAIENANQIVSKPAPGKLMKAIKNSGELDGFRKVMVRDGVAMVKFIYWLKHSGVDQNLSEYEIGLKLKEFRAQGENFVGESFGSIVGYQGNGAIVHYSANKKDSSIIKRHGSILVDSGGQYKEGTTDITRTFGLGELSQTFIEDCTTVLKGMIDLSLVHFPKGTKGVHLDSIARLPLWMNHKDYGHGTGHGVGSFMNVHEGPQNIRKDLNPQDLLPGMVLSNEPGFYKENEYGIRHENLITVRELETSDFGTFYEFETLTVCPFFKEVIKEESLDENQIQWLNNYHSFCKSKLEKHLDGEVKQWFLELVSPI